MDTLNPTERSERMKLIRSSNTRPELALRGLVYSMGLRYRLNSKAIYGSPDIANATKKIAIFVHGCFWHRHKCSSGQRQPKSRTEFWNRKFERNVQRDHEVQAHLKKEGWRTLVIWECQLRSKKAVEQRLKRFLHA